MDEENELFEDVINSVATTVDYTYESNDLCLTIMPYTNYKKIGLFVKGDDGTTQEYLIDRSSTYRYLLEFGDINSKRIVTIKECVDYYDDDNYVQLASNELLFRITDKESSEILAMSSRSFNVIREIISDDDNYGVTTERQSLFIGKWATINEKKNINASQVIQELQAKVSELTDTNDTLNKRIIELMLDNANLMEEIERLRGFEKYKDLYEDLLEQVNSANEYTGTAIEHDVKYIKVDIDDENLANQVNDYLDTLNM